MQSLLSLMKHSSMSSHEILDSEQGVSKRVVIPSLKTPFENDKLRSKKEMENNVSLVDLSNQCINLQSNQLDNLCLENIEIDFSHNYLQQFPQQLKYEMFKLRKCPDLKLLNLSFNQISHISIKLPFSCLEILNLSDNQIRIIPSALCKIASLKVLLLNNNFIEILPEEIFNLQLVKFGLRANFFTTLPNKFNDILKTLAWFDFDWLDYCGVDKILDSQSKNKLIQLGIRTCQRQEVITFSLFYFYMTGKVFDVYQQNECGQNMLFQFILRESYGLIKFYCQKSSDLFQGRSIDTPLIYAFNLRRNKCLQYLIPHYHQSSEDIEIGFLMAVRRLDLGVIQMLISYKVNVNCTSKQDIIGANKLTIGYGQTAMHVAMTSFGRSEQQQKLAQSVVKLLLELGCDPNARNPQKLTSLHCAVKLPSLAAVRFASQFQMFNFTKRDVNKNTPLHSAASQGLVTILQLVQGRNVNPFLINLQNKTAKQVSIASLQVIKQLRKYEYFYLKRRLLLDSEEARAQQTVNSYQSIQQNQTDIRSQVSSPQSNPAKRTFRLNLNQVKLMEQTGRFQSAQQMSSARTLAPKINEILSEIQRILRKQQSFIQMILDMKTVFSTCEFLQEQLIVTIFLSMMIMRMKYGWRYVSSFSTSTIELLNNSKFSYQKNDKIDYFTKNSLQNIKKYKEYSQSVGEVIETQAPIFQYLKNQLSLNLRFNIENNWRETQQEKEKFYENSIGEQQWILGMKGLKVLGKQDECISNRMILQDYELFHNNCANITQYLRIGQRNLDFYKDQRVDNSESQGCLSDRISLYNKNMIPLTNRVQQVRKPNKMEYYYKNVSQTARRVTPQVKQHNGERAQTFRAGSLYQPSEDQVLFNMLE